MGANYCKHKIQIWRRDGNVQRTIRNVGLELGRKTVAKDTDLQVEILIKHEISEADRGLQLKIWLVEVGWRKSISQKWWEKQKRKLGQWNIGLIFVSLWVGKSSGRAQRTWLVAIWVLTLTTFVIWMRSFLYHLVSQSVKWRQSIASQLGIWGRIKCDIEGTQCYYSSCL